MSDILEANTPQEAVRNAAPNDHLCQGDHMVVEAMDTQGPSCPTKPWAIDLAEGATKFESLRERPGSASHCSTMCSEHKHSESEQCAVSIMRDL
jgi:hypothetical protein